MRHLAPVGSEPRNVFERQRLGLNAAEEAGPPEDRMLASQLHKAANELDQLAAGRVVQFEMRRARKVERDRRIEGRPIEPADLVILAVRIVVSALGALKLVAREQHWNPLREQQRREKVALLFCPQRENLAIQRLAFGAAVPAVILLHSVSVVVEICLVVLAIVRNEIVQRKPVMGGDEVDACARPPSA